MKINRKIVLLIIAALTAAFAVPMLVNHFKPKKKSIQLQAKEYIKTNPSK